MVTCNEELHALLVPLSLTQHQLHSYKTTIPVDETHALGYTMKRYHYNHKYNKPATILIVETTKIPVIKEQQLLMCVPYLINRTLLIRITYNCDMRFIAFHASTRIPSK